MAVIKSETWDGVTAPANPAGWNISAPLVTETSLFQSSANGFGTTSATQAAGSYYATWATTDGAGGDVSVSCDVYLSSNAVGGGRDNNVAVLARGSAATLNNTSTDQYQLQLINGDFSGSGQALTINYVHNGSQTIVGSSVTITGTVYTTWYTITLTLNGTTLSGTMQRKSDGFWLNSSGVFQSGSATACSGTHSTLTGSGFAGIQLGGLTRTGVTAVDNWLLSSLAAPAGMPDGLNVFCSQP